MGRRRSVVGVAARGVLRLARRGPRGRRCRRPRNVPSVAAVPSETCVTVVTRTYCTDGTRRVSGRTGRTDCTPTHRRDPCANTSSSWRRSSHTVRALGVPWSFWSLWASLGPPWFGRPGFPRTAVGVRPGRFLPRSVQGTRRTVANAHGGHGQNGCVVARSRTVGDAPVPRCVRTVPTDRVF